jgi:uncharacterized protein YfeS
MSHIETLREEWQDALLKGILTNEEVADWWLSKFVDHDKELIEKLKAMRHYVGNDKHDDEVEKIGYNTALTHVIKLIEKQ